LRSIAQKRPESVKGRYMQRALVKTSMGPTIKLDLTPYQALGARAQ
jgi:ribosomal protein L1